jgi:CheY-like chemotaxis protein
LPSEDGYGLMHRVRTLAPDAGGEVPAIAVTGYAGPEDRERAFDAGFNRHFTKPVDPAELAGAVTDLLARRRP